MNGAYWDRVWHRLQHIFVANTKTRIERRGREVWMVKECQRCGVEFYRWFLRGRHR